MKSLQSRIVDSCCDKKQILYENQCGTNVEQAVSNWILRFEKLYSVQQAHPPKGGNLSQEQKKNTVFFPLNYFQMATNFLGHKYLLFGPEYLNCYTFGGEL